jgi:hypothetical protein
MHLNNETDTCQTKQPNFGDRFDSVRRIYEVVIVKKTSKNTDKQLNI